MVNIELTDKNHGAVEHQVAIEAPTKSHKKHVSYRKQPWYAMPIGIRFHIIRMISCPIPFLTNAIPFIGGKSLIELGIMAFFAWITISVSLPDAEGAGRIADYLGAVVVITGLKNNILTMLFGISYERALFYHKCFAGMAIAVTIIHAFTGMVMAALAMVIVMGLISVLYFIKDFWFEGFYYAHLIGVILIIPFGALHKSSWFVYACFIWMADMLLRYLITLHREKAQACILPGNVIKISFDKSFSYEAGQYCFLHIKELSLVEFHPFSISSSPHMSTITFHIRELGDWSKRLGQLVAEGTKDGQDSMELDVAVEGPYGYSAVNLDDTDYTVFLLISGGIGITPLQGIYNDLVDQAANGRKLRKVVFVWSVRDKAMVEGMDNSVHHPLPVSRHEMDLPVSFQPQAVAVQPRSKSELAHHHHALDDNAAVEEAEKGHLKEEDDLHNILSDYIFFNEYYLTKVREDKESFDAANIRPDAQHHLRFGRPDVADIFAKAAQVCVDSDAKRVAVCVCGPKALVDDVALHCRRTQMRPECSTIRFDLQQEIFDF
jgi:predicted ferric reductase